MADQDSGVETKGTSAGAPDAYHAPPLGLPKGVAFHRSGTSRMFVGRNRLRWLPFSPVRATNPLGNRNTVVVPGQSAGCMRGWWRGRKWAVTEHGIERLDGGYAVAAGRLLEGTGSGDLPEPGDLS